MLTTIAVLVVMAMICVMICYYDDHFAVLVIMALICVMICYFDDHCCFGYHGYDLLF